MQIFSRTSVAVLLCSTLLAACTKETVRVEPASLPPAKIESTVSSIKKNKVTFEKSSLGKLFLLMPTMTPASRSAEPHMLRSLIVSFELNGDRVAIYNRTYKDLQTDVTADVLLQTFQVLEETDTQVVFDIGQGFTSMNGADSMAMVNPDSYTVENMLGEMKVETAINLKDSFVKSLVLKNNSIYINQAIRISSKFGSGLTDEQKKSAFGTAKIPDEVESGGNLAVEIKPYFSNEAFKIKEYDNNERYGFFVNKVPSDSGRPSKGQIVRWDISESRGPIMVLVDKNLPKNLESGVTAAVGYWNRIFGREVMKVEFGFDKSDLQPDRSIVFTWVRYDNGSGAFANTQYDPMTGEVLRGMVYMTTTFTAENKYGVDDIPNEMAGLLGMPSLCKLEISARDLNKANVLTEVTAHELGHVLGLRHNFAGSANAPATDLEIKAAMDRVAIGDLSKPVALSSSTMDYFPLKETVVLGEFMSKGTLPYDQMAIDWAYKDKEIARTANMYCSDEHIAAVAVAGRSILGCARQDLYKNTLFAEREKLRAQAELAVDIATMVMVKGKAGVESVGPDMFVQYAINFNPTFDFAKKLSKSAQPLLTVDDVVPTYLEMLGYSSEPKKFENASGDQKITYDLLDMSLNMTTYVKSLSLDSKVLQDLIAKPKVRAALIRGGYKEEMAEKVIVALLARAKQIDEGLAEKTSKLIPLDDLRVERWK